MMSLGISSFSVKYSKIVHGNINQGEPFLLNPGIQCTRICLEACTMSYEKPLESWSCHDIDNIIHILCSLEIIYLQDYIGSTDI